MDISIRTPLTKVEELALTGKPIRLKIVHSPFLKYPNRVSDVKKDSLLMYAVADALKRITLKMDKSVNLKKSPSKSTINYTFSHKYAYLKWYEYKKTPMHAYYKSSRDLIKILELVQNEWQKPYLEAKYISKYKIFKDIRSAYLNSRTLQETLYTLKTPFVYSNLLDATLYSILYKNKHYYGITSGNHYTLFKKLTNYNKSVKYLDTKKLPEHDENLWNKLTNIINNSYLPRQPR